MQSYGQIYGCSACEAEECTNIAQVMRCRPIANSFHLIRHRIYSLPWTDTRWPKNSVSRLNSTHLDSLTFKPTSRSLSSMIRKRSNSSWGVLAKTMILCKYERQIFQRWSFNTCDINLQNEAGAPANPNGIRVNWKSLRRVQEADRSLARSVIPSCRYPESRSIVAK